MRRADWKRVALAALIGGYLGWLFLIGFLFWSPQAEPMAPVVPAPSPPMIGPGTAPVPPPPLPPVQPERKASRPEQAQPETLDPLDRLLDELLKGTLR